MNLIIDIGNTRAKVALFSCGELVESYIVEPLTKEYIDELLQRHPGVNQAIVSSTRGNIDEVVAMLDDIVDYVVAVVLEKVIMQYD
jgi:type III pantothenate kinase